MPPLDIACLDLSPQHLDQLQTLLTQYVPQADVWAYGSRVTGGAHECSDLDLVLRHHEDCSADVQGWAELKLALQESDLPLLVDVHRWWRIPESFHDNIRANYVVIRRANPTS
jgi:DNA polymerase sigma